MNFNGVFTSRLGSNFNLDTSSQHSLLSQKHGSMLSIHNLLPRGSVPNFQNQYKVSWTPQIINKHLKY